VATNGVDEKPIINKRRAVEAKKVESDLSFFSLSFQPLLMIFSKI
jgi:hypothetical protein